MKINNKKLKISVKRQDIFYMLDLAADFSLAAACSVRVARSSASSASPCAFLWIDQKMRTENIGIAELNTNFNDFSWLCNCI